MITVVSFATKSKYKEGFGPLTPGFVSVPFGNLDAVERPSVPTHAAFWWNPCKAKAV